MIFRYATVGDKIIFAIATICSVLFGAAMPAFVLVFGGMVDSVGETSAENTMGFDQLSSQSVYMLLIATGVFFVSSTNIILFSIFSENISYRIRLMYFKSCLEKDASYYDDNNPAEMASRIVKECSSINRGTGDKIGVVFQSISSILCGFTFAFYWGY